MERIPKKTYREIISYRDSLGQIRRLNSEEEIAYGRAYRDLGDEQARNKLVFHNLPLVPFVICGNWTSKLNLLEPGDLIQDMNVVLIGSSKSWDIEQGFRFNTYAVSSIANQLKKYVQPDATLELSKRSLSFYFSELKPYFEDCERKGISPDFERFAGNSSSRAKSNRRNRAKALYMMHNSSTLKLEGIGIERKAPFIGLNPADSDLADFVRKIIYSSNDKSAKLSDREKLILTRLFNDINGWTQEQIRVEVGLNNPQRVQQMRDKALMKLTALLE